MARPFSIAVDGVGCGLGGVDGAVVSIERSKVVRKHGAITAATASDFRVVHDIQCVRRGLPHIDLPDAIRCTVAERGLVLRLPGRGLALVSGVSGWSNSTLGAILGILDIRVAIHRIPDSLPRPDFAFVLYVVRILQVDVGAGRGHKFARLRLGDLTEKLGHGNSRKYPQDGNDHHELYERETAPKNARIHNQSRSCNGSVKKN